MIELMKYILFTRFSLSLLNIALALFGIMDSNFSNIPHFGGKFKTWIYQSAGGYTRFLLLCP